MNVYAAISTCQWPGADKKQFKNKNSHKIFKEARGLALKASSINYDF